MNKVLLAGRLTRDPEMRALAPAASTSRNSAWPPPSTPATARNAAEFHNIVTWDRLAEVCGRYLGKGQQVALEGRLQTRTWDDEKGLRHWKTEIVASSVEMLSGRKKKDYAAESAADAIEDAAAEPDEAPSVPADEPIAEELAA